MRFRKNRSVMNWDYELSQNTTAHSEELLLPPGGGRRAGEMSPGHVFTPPEQSSVYEYLRILNRWKWVFVAVVVGSLLAVGGLSLIMRPVYQAAGRIFVNRETPDTLGFKDMGATPTESSDDLTLALDTQVDILRSDSLALNTIRTLGLDRDPQFAGRKSSPVPAETRLLERFRENLEIARLPRSQVLEIRYSSSNPKVAAAVVNTLTNLYMEQNFTSKFHSTMQTSKWLSSQLAELKQRVEDSQEKLVQYQKSNSIVGNDDKENIVTDKLNELNRDLTAAEAERIQKEANYRLASSGNPELVAGGDMNGLIQKLRAQEADLKDQYALATTSLGPAHPKVQGLKNQMNELSTTIREETSRIAGRYQSEYLVALRRERMLRDALELQKNQANQLSEKEIEYNILKRDFESNRQLYEGLLQKYKEANVSAGLRADNVRIVDTASVPSRPVRPDIPRYLAETLCMSVIAGLMLIAMLEKMEQRQRQSKIFTIEQAHRASGLGGYGLIPLANEVNGNGRRSHALLPARNHEIAQTSKSRAELVSYHRPKSRVAESYRALRTSILMSSADNPPKVMVVTSALPQEGKTTTSINLAMVLAQTGGRVLLVDADMRRSGIHVALGIQGATDGLSTVLIGGSSAEQAILSVPEFPNLHVLPAGPSPTQPAELLSSAAMKNDLMDWRIEFDYVVLDTPPVLAVTDAVVLAAMADLVLLVSRMGETPVEALASASSLLAHVTATTGVVVNAVDTQSDRNPYYRYGSNVGGNYYEG